MNYILTGKTTILFIILVFVLGGVIGFGFGSEILMPMAEFSVTTGYNTTITEKCKDLPLDLTARCVVRSVRPIFKYNVTSDWVNLSEEELMERGGDCRDWSMYYKKLFLQLGFHSDTHVIIADAGSAHRFATVSDNTGWCVISEINYICFEFGEEQKEGGKK